MHRIVSRALVAILFAAFAAHGSTQEKDKDESKKADKAKLDEIARMDNFILDMFKAHKGKTLCMLGDVPVGKIRGMVVEMLKVYGVAAGQSAAQEQVETAVWTLFPCPFSPFRAEVLPATAKDVEGVWLFPHDAQPYRYGPNSSQQPTSPDKAGSCEAVGYYPKGELRTAVVMGANTPCPFQKAADLAPARKRPRVASWEMIRDGRLKVTRTDVNDYVEEWDIFVATKAFAALNMQIKAGDLIAYLRRDMDNNVNAATEFRLLQRLK
ncbi:MAG TPA: hypothetical protein VMU46_00860 [Burkholderiales bacterium]|nr:hypothetical protein [Burkholderiales bacterium]